MAKATTKRKSPAKRKPAAKRPGPGWAALSGWVVAAGLGAAWAGPQLGLWPNDILNRVPSLDQLQKMASLDGVLDPGAPPKRQPSPVAPKPVATRMPDTSPQKTILPPIKPDTISEIVRKADAKPIVAPAKPIPKAATPDRSSGLLPPAPVPSPIPFVTAAIRRDAEPRAPTARPGDLAIRRYPFTTAPAVAYVGDLRTIRILGGDGDWKKVEVSATGVTGWLRLQRLGAKVDAEATPSHSASMARPPIPAAPLLKEADAAGSR